MSAANTWPSIDPLVPCLQGAMLLLYPFTDPLTISTEIELLPLVSIGPRFDQLVLTIRNFSATHSVAAWANNSESGIVRTIEREQRTIPPLSEGQFVIHEVLANFWGISAAGDPDASFPPCDVAWMVHGRRRPF